MGVLWCPTAQGCAVEMARGAGGFATFRLAGEDASEKRETGKRYSTFSVSAQTAAACTQSVSLLPAA